VDVPSGVEASTGVVASRAVYAAVTVTFHAAKPGLWIRPGKTHAGDVRTIGHFELIESLRVGQFGTAWMAGFLDCVAQAARTARADLDRLQTAAEKGRALGGTARSKLPAAFDVVLRSPVVTAAGLARTLHVTPQAALGLLRQLLKGEVVREATGRASWRAFVTT